MATILESARAGQVTREMEIVAEKERLAAKEGLTAEEVRQGIVDGTIVVASGNGRRQVAAGIGFMVIHCMAGAHGLNC